MSELTIDHLASDIRQLALEINNIAITVSALIEVIGVDRTKLQAAGQEIFAAAVAEAKEEDSGTAEPEPAPEPISAEQHITENFNAKGDARHPAGAVFFGG